MYNKVCLFIVLFFVVSCGSIDFVYKQSSNLTNPIYNKTEVTFSGKELLAYYRYSSKYFGNVENNNYELGIHIEEEKTKRSVQTNQAVERLDYKLTFKYELFDKITECLVYKKNIISKFSYVPKSSGFNFGSDQALEKLYELALRNNFAQFINFISSENISSCINEE